MVDNPKRVGSIILTEAPRGRFMKEAFVFLALCTANPCLRRPATDIGGKSNTHRVWKMTYFFVLSNTFKFLHLYNFVMGTVSPVFNQLFLVFRLLHASDWLPTFISLAGGNAGTNLSLWCACTNKKKPSGLIDIWVETFTCFPRFKKDRGLTQKIKVVSSLSSMGFDKCFTQTIAFI